MSTSGTTSFARTRDQIVKGAMRLIGVLGAGTVQTAEEISDGAEALNMMVKSWEADGLHLWTETEATLFCAKGQTSYTFPGANATTSYTATTLTAAAVAGATNLTVASIAAISNGQYIGILLDDGTMHWTTVNGAPAGSTVTIIAGLASGAAIGQAVYAYTTQIAKPLRVHTLRLMNLSGNEVPFSGDSEPVSRRTYFNTPNKAATGTPLLGYYDDQRSSGTLYLWLTPDSASHRVRFTYERAIEDFNAITDNPDFPQEWLEALKYNLAVRIAPEYNLDVRPAVSAMADRLYQQLLDWDRDPAPITFEPDWY